MKINKITVGFVVQTFDTETRTFTNQEFVAADEVSWENGYSEPLDYVKDAELIYGKGGVDEPYLNFDMVQPK
jgi:hypothetical protein